MTRTFRFSELAAPLGLALALPLWFIARELSVAGSLGFPLDDSWIHLVFARNIARGDFFAFNPGEHVAGSTAPLWTIILAIGYFVTHDPLLMPKVIGIALHIALVWLSMRLSVLIGASKSLAVVVGLLIAATPRLVWASVSGMEVPLYCVLGILSIDLYLRFGRRNDWRAYACWGTSGIAVWARPELMLLPLFFTLHVLVLRSQKRAAAKGVRQLNPVPWITVAGGWVIALAAMSPFFVLNASLSGHLLPLTFYSKAAGGLSGLLDQELYGELFKRMVTYLWTANVNVWKWTWAQDNLFTAITGVVALGWLIVRLVRRDVDDRTSGILLLVLCTFLYGPIRGVVTGILDFWQYARYGAIVSPLMIIIAAVWLERMLYRVAQRKWLTASVGFVALFTIAVALYYQAVPSIGRGHQFPSFDWYLPFLAQATPIHILAVALLAAVVVPFVMINRVRFLSTGTLATVICLQAFSFSLVEAQQVSTEYAWNVKNINDSQVLLGNWLARSVPKGTVYATNDIGAMAFYAEGNTLIDVMGLVSARISEMRAEIGSSEFTALWVLRTYKPSYFIVFDEWFQGVVTQGMRLGALKRVYTAAIPNNLTSGGKGINAMHVYAVNYDRLPSLLALAGNRVPR
jgi:hypothetical protein